MTEKKYFNCPICFARWVEETDKEETIEVCVECNFCEKNPTSFEILKRQIEVMDTAIASTFPKVIRRLINHLDLKEF